MKASELRLENLILYDGKIVTVGNYTFSQMESEPELFEPIPLTEDWLKRAGIEKDWHNFIVPKMEGVYLCDENSHMDLSNNPIVGDYDACVFIKMPEYVHQLQNLYFTLTGKELVINEL